MPLQKSFWDIFNVFLTAFMRELIESILYSLWTYTLLPYGGYPVFLCTHSLAYKVHKKQIKWLDSFLCVLYYMHIGCFMKVKVKPGKVKGETYDYCLDFMVLSAIEKRVILKTAKALLKQQRENEALLKK